MGRGRPFRRPPQVETNQEFLDSMEVNTSYWYMQASAAQQQRINNLLSSYCDTFTDEKQKVGSVTLMGTLKSI